MEQVIKGTCFVLNYKQYDVLLINKLKIVIVGKLLSNILMENNQLGGDDSNSTFHWVALYHVD